MILPSTTTRNERIITKGALAAVPANERLSVFNVALACPRPLGELRDFDARALYPFLVCVASPGCLLPLRATTLRKVVSRRFYWIRWARGAIDCSAGDRARPEPNGPKSLLLEAPNQNLLGTKENTANSSSRNA
jgi:hypothetical protein